MDMTRNEILVEQLWSTLPVPDRERVIFYTFSKEPTRLNFEDVAASFPGKATPGY